MSEEIFDVVDERDEIVGQERRSEIHRRKLNHRAVHLLIFNSKGELFLQKRSMKKDCFPGTWDSSAAGHLDKGEAYDACAIRELREELGVALERQPERLFKVDACPETGQEFVWVYQGEHEGPFTLNPEEIDAGDWFAPDEITRWMERSPRDFAGGLILIWRRWSEDFSTQSGGEKGLA
jgi:isopentenyl-diphosphate delta-isomerase type 1